MNPLRIICILLIGIFLFPLILFLLSTYGEDTNGTGWYQDLWSKKNIFSMTLAFLLFPIYFLATRTLLFLYEPWEKLGE